MNRQESIPSRSDESVCNVSTRSGDVPSAQDIRSLRNRLYLTRSQFAELVGCSRSSIVNWELGRSKPREDYVKTLSIIAVTELDYPRSLHSESL